MENGVWDALPTEARDEIDALVRKNDRMHAIKVIREAGLDPSPGLGECFALFAERRAALGG
ncbi:hypothetical protein [Streptomyces sp. NPDC051569]|uniref:hypothetical protein n=1 Tax=Streptomyces sp. NPDC051569 TaxID=3365661 RepID=UPI00378861D1